MPQGAATASFSSVRSVLAIAVSMTLAACAARQEEPAPAPPPQATAAPPRDLVEGIAGTVTARTPGRLQLDSGGATPVGVRLDGAAQVTRDGRLADAADIREGDLIRAAVRYGDDGERIALKVYANSVPVSLLPGARPPQARAPRAPAR